MKSRLPPFSERFVPDAPRLPPWPTLLQSTWAYPSTSPTALLSLLTLYQAIVLSQTGATCECHEANRTNCDNIPAYADCKEGTCIRSAGGSVLPLRTANVAAAEVRRDLITGTAAIAGVASFMFGFLTNLPVALAYVAPACPSNEKFHLR